MHLQVLLLNFQLVGQDALFFSSSQHLSSGLDGCFFPQFLHTGASLYFWCFSSRFLFFSSFVLLFVLVGFLLSVLTNVIISFIVSVMLRISASIWHVWFSVSALISSSVTSACSSIAFALNCFAVSLFCLFSFAYDVNPCFVRCRFHFPFADSGIKFASFLEIKYGHVSMLVEVGIDASSGEASTCFLNSVEVELWDFAHVPFCVSF